MPVFREHSAQCVAQCDLHNPMQPKSEWVDTPMAIIHNGYVVMWCYVKGNEVEVYDRTDPRDDKSDEEKYKSLWRDGNFNTFQGSKLGEHVMSFRAKRIFIARCDCPEDNPCCGRMREGHGLLCEMDDDTYVCISGMVIDRFKTQKNERITSFVSQVGNNGVPYPYVTSDLYTYFILDGEAIENSLIPEGVFPYDWLYGEDEGRKAAKLIEYDTETMYELDC